MKRVTLEPAFVLHRRLYRETSLLIEVLTQTHGRFTLIAKGIRKSQSTSAGLLQPFMPILISWSGKNDLMTLTHAEANGLSLLPRKHCLFAGLYLNELMLGLLQKWDPHPQLFMIYQQTLANLQGELLDERTLRLFEKNLLAELGYGLFWKDDASLSDQFLPDKYYSLTPEFNFVLSENTSTVMANMFLGSSLLAMIKEEWHDQQSLQDAKRLSRILLTPLLGDKEINSRQLFVTL